MAQPPTNIEGADLSNDLRAAREARAELGPAYDDHVTQALADRVLAQVRREMAASPRPASRGLTREQRLGLAIASLIFLIPLVAVAGRMFGGWGAAGAFVVVVVINLLALL